MRPYGVGMLVIGYDSQGAHLFENCPSGVYYDYLAQAIGARAQAARTYLEKNFQSFPDRKPYMDDVEEEKKKILI